MKIGILRLSQRALEKPLYEIDRLVEEGSKRGHEIVTLEELYFSFGYNGEIKIFYEGKPFTSCDVIFAKQAATHEPSLHTVTVETLKKAGFQVVNGMPTFSVSKNKLASLLRLGEAEIPIPRSIIVRHPSNAKPAAEDIGYPVVIKIAFGTHGKGVFIAKDPETLQPIADYLNISDRNPIIVQEYIAEARQRDLRVFVIGGEIAAAMERVATGEDFRSNAHLGGVGRPVELTEDEKRIALEATKAMELDISGVDILRSDRGPLVIEVNSNPGYEELEKATGINVALKIIEYLESLGSSPVTRR